MKSRRILLVEPAYRSKYPPLGLMKIAAYHKALGDKVAFVRGCSPEAVEKPWDRVYITTLFSYDWDIATRTITFYDGKLSPAGTKILVGGIAATILADEFKNATGVQPIQGPLDEPHILDPDNGIVVDRMAPDYSILDQVDHSYAYRDAYIGYATRGCVRRCRFCAVRTLEPDFVDYIPIKPWVDAVRAKHGEKRHILLLDNNVLASSRLADIVADLQAVGFTPGARFEGRLRYVDFNQGLDARLLTKRRMSLLAELPINPFRLAYDSLRLKETYEKAVRTAAAAGVHTFSSYLLYNYTEEPTDLWDRIHHNVKLSGELKIRITSFPMKYIPVNHHDRGYVGKHWNRRYLRSIQCISLVTKGVVSARHDFFHAAFGQDHSDFLEILAMPEHYVINRSRYRDDGAADWRRRYRRLGAAERSELLASISVRGRAAVTARWESVTSPLLQDILSHYV